MSDAARTATISSGHPVRTSFGPEPDIDEGGWRGVADIALALLLAGPGVVVLLGEAGSGKTQLLAHLEPRLRASGRDAVLIPNGHAALEGGRACPVLAYEDTQILLIDDVQTGAGVIEALIGLGRRKCLIAAQPEFEACLLALPVPPAILRLPKLSPANRESGPRAEPAPRPAYLSYDEDEVPQPAPIQALTLYRPGSVMTASTNDRLGAPNPATPGREWVVWGLTILIIGCIAAFMWTDLSAGPAQVIAAAPPAPPSQTVVPVPVVPPSMSQPTPGIPPGMPPSMPATPQPVPQMPSIANPPATPTRLVLSYPRGDAAMASGAARLAKALSRAGYVVGVPVPAPNPRGRPNLTVFYLEDQPAAATLRDALGRDAPAVSLVPSAGSGFLPRPGTIELSLGGSATLDRWSQSLETAPPVAAPATTGVPNALPGAAPADGATIASDALRVRLAWRQTDPGATSFLEVVELGPPPTHTVFAGFVEQAATQLELGAPGATYAWRVFFVRPDSIRYQQSRWYRFSTGAN